MTADAAAHLWVAASAGIAGDMLLGALRRLRVDTDAVEAFRRALTEGFT